MMIVSRICVCRTQKGVRKRLNVKLYTRVYNICTYIYIYIIYYDLRGDKSIPFNNFWLLHRRTQAAYVSIAYIAYKDFADKPMNSSHQNIGAAISTVIWGPQIEPKVHEVLVFTKKLRPVKPTDDRLVSIHGWSILGSA